MHRAALLLLCLGVAAACGGERSGAPDDPGPVHVHGLGIDPADGALYIATHTGLYRAAPGERVAERVGESRQDTMGFTVAGPGHFLGSGHPDLDEARERGLPALLGLIESLDAGRSWQPVSLAGEADFHVLRLAGGRIYGYDASGDRLLASDDGGRSWTRLAHPGPLVDLVADPANPRRLLAAAEAGLFESEDGGETWRHAGGAVGYLAWPAPGRIYLVAGDGAVLAGGRELEPRGALGGPPAALLATGPDELYAALHDGTVKQSRDGGRTWTVRSAP